MFDATKTEDGVRLCGLIDGGDREALLILADLLEEHGDGRSVGLRNVGRHMPRQIFADTRFQWYEEHHDRDDDDDLLADVFRELRGGILKDGMISDYRNYDSLSAAYLDYAQAWVAARVKGAKASAV